MAVDERSPLLPERADTAEPVNADDEAGQKNRLKVGISIMVALLGELPCHSSQTEGSVDLSSM